MRASLFTLLLSLVVYPFTALSQHALLIFDEEGHHLVTRVTSTSYEYLHEGKPRQEGIEQSRTSLIPIKTWYPGRINIKDLKATAHTFTGMDNESYALEYKIKFVANRDIKDAYLIYFTEDPRGGKFKVAVKVGNLRKGKQKRIVSSLTVPRDFADQRFQTLFMAAGHQILSTEYDIALSTPYDRWLYEVPAEEQTDGPPKPTKMIRPSVVKDENGEPLEGKVTMRLKVDESGYVTLAEPVEPEAGKLVQAVLDVIYLWEFKPQIKDGEPMACELQVPFNF